MNPKKYVSEALVELKSVQWPTKQHAIRISTITAIFVVCSTLVIFAVDFLLSQLVNMFY